ncbi:CHAT domain-containing protein [Microcoleus sp. herbarium12]|uniref:CHAT domain-containing protein n=1 Tax=Microcoleus sp. herbarium12 TaxID=3055437 RepID=UPI002FD41C7B
MPIASAILNQLADTYGFLQTALVAQQKTDRALEIAERGRARAFVELLNKKQSENSENQLNVEPPTVSQIKEIAKAQNATLIEYSVISSRELYIWVIQPGGKIFFRRSNFTNIDAGLGEIAEVTRVAAAVDRGTPQSESILTEFVRGTRQAAGAETGAATRCRGKNCLQQMYRLLIEPIADLLPANPQAKIIFIPHQSLFLVPFAALQDAEGKYLIAKHTILTAPAIQILQLTRTARQRRRENNQLPLQAKDILIVGNPEMPWIGNPPRQLAPLPGSETEAIAISQILNTKPLIGKQATETLVKQLMLDAKIIHLATHGLLNELTENQVPGAIALAASQTDDGLLTSSEILDLRLQAELVVLSACNTGRGTITGDGVMGLSRSLMTAGATSVVVSLWYVPDGPTSLLMMEFYRQMQVNPDKAQALGQAMLTVAKEYPNSSNWAAFTLMGESD